MVSEDFLLIFYETMAANHPQVANLNPGGYRLQRISWIYVVNNNNVLLQLNIKATGFMVSEYFFSVFPIIRTLRARPS